MTAVNRLDYLPRGTMSRSARDRQRDSSRPCAVRDIGSAYKPFRNASNRSSGRYHSGVLLEVALSRTSCFNVRLAYIADRELLLDQRVDERCKGLHSCAADGADQRVGALIGMFHGLRLSGECACKRECQCPAPKRQAHDRLGPPVNTGHSSAREIVKPIACGQ